MKHLENKYIPSYDRECSIISLPPIHKFSYKCSFVHKHSSVDIPLSFGPRIRVPNKSTSFKGLKMFGSIHSQWLVLK